MKKLSLNAKSVNDILSREELKKIVGGSGGGSGRCKSRHTHCGNSSEKGTCESRNDGKCVCNTGTSSWLAEECVA